MIQKIKERFFTIGFISFLSIFLVALASLIFIGIFAKEYTQIQKSRLNAEFEKNTLFQAEAIDAVVEKAKQNVSRLHGYISILNLLDAKRSVQYLKNVMAQNIQFDKDEYNCYFALQPELARKYFKKDAYILTVHKRFDKRGTKEYGKPDECVVKEWTSPEYQTSKKEVWYQIAKLGKGCQISPVYFDRSYMKVWMFTVSQGIYQGDRFMGMVGIDILLDDLLEQIEKVKIGETGGLIIVNNDSGLVITKNANPGRTGFIKVKERFKENLFANAELKKIWMPLLKHNNGVSTMKGFNNKEYLFSSRRLKQLPWTIIAFQSRKESRELLYRRLQGIGEIGLLLLLFFVGITYFSARNLTKPINQLIGAMKKVKGDDVSGVSAPVGGTNETRLMGEIFNRMLKTIEGAVKDKEVYYSRLEEMNLTLEEKVEERTKQLTGKNAELEDLLRVLQDTQDQLVLKEKLASLGALTAGIAHEIKNPLNFVNNFAFLSVELLDELNDITKEVQEKLDEDKKEEMQDILDMLKQNVTQINEHGKRADNIVKNMLLHSRGKPGDMQVVDLNATVDQYLNLAFHGQRAVDAGFNIDIRTDYDSSIGSLRLVPQEFGRVILNLANNAFYATAEKGKTAGSSFSPELSVSTKKVNETVEIRMRDNGTGIPDEIKNEIFNPFFTTKPPGVSTGLGLSLSQDIIVQEHHGEFSVETKKGEWTEFLIRIPAVFAPATVHGA